MAAPKKVEGAEPQGTQPESPASNQKEPQGTQPESPVKQAVVTRKTLKTVQVAGLFGGYRNANFDDKSVAVVDVETHAELVARFGDAVVEVSAE